MAFREFMKFVFKFMFIKTFCRENVCEYGPLYLGTITYEIHHLRIFVFGIATNGHNVINVREVVVSIKKLHRLIKMCKNLDQTELLWKKFSEIFFSNTQIMYTEAPLSGRLITSQTRYPVKKAGRIKRPKRKPENKSGRKSVLPAFWGFFWPFRYPIDWTIGLSVLLIVGQVV